MLLKEKQRYWLDLLWVMTEKEMRVRYKRAGLGFLWMVLQPLSQMFVLGFVFQFFVPVEVDNYFLFLFSGLLPWTFFSASLSRATSAFVNERSLIHKAKFPREVIVLAVVLSNLIHFLASLLILVLLLIGDKLFLENYSLMRLISYFLRMLWLLPIISLLYIFTNGACLLASSLNVKFRDTNFIVQSGLILWFYGSPVIYSLSLLPELAWPIFSLNPMVGIIEWFHWVLLKIPVASWTLSWISIPIGSIIVFFGIKVFTKNNNYFIDRI